MKRVCLSQWAQVSEGKSGREPFSAPENEIFVKLPDQNDPVAIDYNLKLQMPRQEFANRSNDSVRLPPGRDTARTDFTGPPRSRARPALTIS